MFGFLQAPSSPCCGRPPEIWRSHFCGLATRMHQDFGPWSRFLINRDSTFLAIAGAEAMPPVSRIGTCCNPLAKPKPLLDSGRAVEYAADITLCALGIKLKDDSCDEGWPRRLLAKVGHCSLQPALDKAIARLNTHGFTTARVEEIILSQEEVEATGPDAWAASQPTALAYGEIFAQMPGAAAIDWKETGTSLGRLIYWDDAWQDWKKDQKRRRFNPLQQTAAPELREMMVSEFASFEEQLSQLAPSPIADTLQQVATQTASRIPNTTATPGEPKKKRKQRPRKDKNNDRCCDCCDCACSPGGGCCDSLVDCGPGDTGCCDCCPCDCG